jgi:hypothetical protein
MRSLASLGMTSVLEARVQSRALSPSKGELAQAWDACYSWHMQTETVPGPRGGGIRYLVRP